MEHFPPNSRKEQARHEPKPRVEQVTSGRRRRRPLGKQFKTTFFGGDARTAGEYMIFEVGIPLVRDMVVETITSGFERWVLGDRGPRRRIGPMGGYLGHTPYNRMSQGPQPETRTSLQQMSRRARARHDFGEIVLPTMRDADEVLDRMFDILSKHGETSVADLYELTGIESSHVDKNWGWTDLRGASVGRIRGGGYVLQLPEPESMR